MKCNAPWCSEEIDPTTNNLINGFKFCGNCWYQIMNGLIPSFMLKFLMEETEAGD